MCSQQLRLGRSAAMPISNLLSGLMKGDCEVQEEEEEEPEM